MDIKSKDTKQLTIDTEKGPINLFLPIGIQLEDCLKAAGVFYTAFQKAIALVEEKKKEEEEKKEKV